MITGLLYDKPDRSYQASLLKEEGDNTVLVVVWPSMPGEVLISGKFPEVFRARQVENTSAFDWENLGQAAGYYIASYNN